MKIFSKFIFGFHLAFLLCGCQMGYIMKSGIGQMRLLSHRVPINEVLQDPKLDAKKKEKLLLALEAHKFAETELKLKPTKNYTTYVELNQPYVTYVISAAPKWELKAYQWSYPFMGKMPYKGYFDEADAKQEALNIKASEDLDIYLRGVSAYSTLGWFNDPLLSSMLKYQDYDLINTIIHETTHATLYIKHAADFNERLATFAGNKGAELFYLKKEGKDSATLKKIADSLLDEKIFSQFISTELNELELWYKNLPPSNRNEEMRQDRIKLVQKRFAEKIQPLLKTDNYSKFVDLELNNARLLLYRTYLKDLNDFQRLYELSNEDFSSFIEKCKALEGADDPEAALKSLIAQKTKL